LKTSPAFISTCPRSKALSCLLGEDGHFELSRSDLAFALRLQREETVWRARLDNALARFLTRPLHKLDRRTLMVLRLGAVQLLVLGTPPHAAVSETVKLGADRGVRGLINAVLRRLSLEGEEEGLPLHVRWSHPKEMVQRWVDRIGPTRTLSLLQWNNAPPVLGGYAFEEPPPGQPGTYLDRYRVFERSVPLPPPGVFVQDEAASLAARAFQELPGNTALEMGAAPGGKTAHQRCPFTVSLDLSEKRMKKWLENRNRLRWSNVFPLVADGLTPPFSSGFHKVLLDAPCTNTGVLRRRPEARWRWSRATMARLVGIQKMLLDSAAGLTIPGGYLVYSTCSMEPEENLEQVLGFEERNPEFLRISLGVPRPLSSDGMMVSFPPESGVDGIFAAAWRRLPLQ